jgi:hypothetical protein
MLDHRDDYQLARLGLQGTLWGAWASLIAIVAIVALQVATNRYVLQGWPLAAMVIAIVVAVTFYGSFIFNKALSISGNVSKSGVLFAADSSNRLPQPNQDRNDPQAPARLADSEARQHG